MNLAAIYNTCPNLEKRVLLIFSYKEAERSIKIYSGFKYRETVAVSLIYDHNLKWHIYSFYSGK